MELSLGFICSVPVTRPRKNWGMSVERTLCMYQPGETAGSYTGLVPARGNRLVGWCMRRSETTLSRGALGATLALGLPWVSRMTICWVVTGAIP